MTRSEQRQITSFIEALAQVGAPIDVEADAIIRALLVRNPEAAYRLTRLAIAQAEALERRAAEPVTTGFGSRWLSRLFGRHRHTERRRKTNPPPAGSAPRLTHPR